MASSSSSKRPAVFRLAEQTGHSSVYNQYEITLPFFNKLPYYNRLECCCQEIGDGSTAECVACSFAKVKETALRQTEKRWAWFSEAHKLDNKLGRRLGTLGYLPLEIRDKIWHAAIEDCMDGSMVLNCYPSSWVVLNHTYKWNYGPMDMNITPEIVLQPHDDGEFGLNLHPKRLFQRSWQRNGVPQLRDASPELNIEVEDVLVSNYQFRFRCPVVLSRYLSTTSAWQVNRLRSIVFELSGCCRECCERRVPWRPWFKNCRQGWIASLERLPAGIKLIKFELGWHYSHLGSPDVYVKEVLAHLEIMTKKTRRLAPDAEIQVSGQRALRYKDRDILRDIIDEIDDHSEDYKKWWRESHEKTKGQREEA